MSCHICQKTGWAVSWKADGEVEVTRADWLEVPEGSCMAVASGGRTARATFEG